MLWATPIQVFDVSTVKGSIDGTAADTPKLHKSLSSGAIAAFETFRNDEALVDAFSQSGNRMHSANDAFFFYQRERAFRGDRAPAAIDERSAEAMQRLRAHIRACVLHFAGAALGPRQAEEWRRGWDENGDDIFVWATVHGNGTFHSSHVHHGSAISGVYFAKAGDNAGVLQLFDPRGPLKPYGRVYLHEPTAGELLLFPSSLAHQVSPTPGTDLRVSFSFNVPGSWEELADVSRSISFDRGGTPL